jgi:hypothetical protein
MRSSQSSGIRPNQPLRKAKSRAQSGNKCVNPGRRREDLCVSAVHCVSGLHRSYSFIYLLIRLLFVLDARMDRLFLFRSAVGPVRLLVGVCVCLTGVPRCLLAVFVKLESGFRCPAGGAGILWPHAAVWQQRDFFAKVRRGSAPLALLPLLLPSSGFFSLSPTEKSGPAAAAVSLLVCMLRHGGAKGEDDDTSCQVPFW